jgi:hypothetical protein
MPLQGLALGRMTQGWYRQWSACRRVAAQTVTGNLPASRYFTAPAGVAIRAVPAQREQRMMHERLSGCEGYRMRPLLGRVQQQEAPIVILGQEDAHAGWRNLDPVDRVRVHSNAVRHQAPQHVAMAHQGHYPSGQPWSAPHLLQRSEASTDHLGHGLAAGNFGRASPLVEVTPFRQSVKLGERAPGPLTEIQLIEPSVLDDGKAESGGQGLRSLHCTFEGTRANRSYR